MKKRRLTVGDLVEIPIAPGVIANGWMICESGCFKDMIGVVVFGYKGQKAKDIVYDEETGDAQSLSALVVYTHALVPFDYGWKVLENHPPSDHHLQMTRRLVGGGVYVGDEYLGPPVSVADKNLPDMSVTGMPGLVREIQEAFGEPPVEQP